MLFARTSSTRGRRDANRPRTPIDSVAAAASRSRMATLQSAIGNQAILRYLNSPAPVLQRKCDCGGSGTDCPECKKKEGELQRKSAPTPQAQGAVPPIVHTVLRSPGQPLDGGTRTFMESRFGQDFSSVRVHTDDQAARSAHTVDALAYTVGQQVVFARNAYSPTSAAGTRLLAHELAHVVQQGNAKTSTPRRIGPENDSSEREADTVANHVMEQPTRTGLTQGNSAEVLQRTPARKVSCAPGPLHLPDGTVIADPVAVITAAENRANELLDAAIGELDFTRQAILGGATIDFPTISDGLAFAMQLMGLDPNSERVWRRTGGPGNYTAELLLRRLRMIRSTIGAGSFFFTCLGPRNGTIPGCLPAPLCDGNADASSCPGSFRIVFCDSFWQTAVNNADDQAAIIIHETAHNFADFIGDAVHRGAGVAECYTRFALLVGGPNAAAQRTDLCPDPP